MATAKIHPDAGLTTRHFVRDLPASIVVFLVAMPLCMGIAIASGAPVSTGLVTGIVGGLVVGFLSGSPLVVSGPAAGLTVIVYSLIQTLGIEKLGVVVLAAGALQLAAGYFKLGQWFRAVSPAVIQGMLAGIGALIFASQFHVMVDDKPHHSGIENFLTIPQAVIKSFPPPALGDRQQRVDETEELRQLGQLHLKQDELKEATHHLLSGAAEPEKLDAAEKERLSGVLKDLAAKQEALLTELAAFAHPRVSEPEFPAARDAVAAATNALQAGDIVHARAAQDEAEAKIDALLRSRKNHGFAALLGLITIGTIVGWKFIAHGRLKLVPGPLVAVVIATALAFFLQLPVLYVQLPDSLADEIYLPRTAELFALLEPMTWFFIAQLAVIASAETLLSASAVDRLHTGPRTDYDRELRAQGIGNMICGFFCALPMTGVIVRSSANVQAGARTRLSTIMHGAWLLLFVVAFAWLLRSIPTSALAGILVFTGYKLMDYKAAKQLAKRGQSEIAIYLATFVTIVATDLLIGVLVGIALSIAKLLYVFSKLEIDVEPQNEAKHTIRLRGSATFLKVPALAQALDDVPPHAELHVNVEHLDYIDAACLDLLDGWEAQHEKEGARLVIDSESLEARFWRRKAGALPHPMPVAHLNGDGATNGETNGVFAETNGHGHNSSLSQRHRRRPI